MRVKIWTDGACSGNPGPGGWAAILKRPNNNKVVVQGKKDDTTNNEMELLALINALEMLAPGESAIVYSDSKYVVDGITKWIGGWIKRGWVTSSKAPVKHADLWKHLLVITDKNDVQFEWVRGHSTTEIHYVDQLAKKQYA